MPFAMRHAPATFQCLMDQVLDGLQHCAICYIDDITVFIKTWENHLKDWYEVLGRLDEHKALKMRVRLLTCAVVGPMRLNVAWLQFLAVNSFSSRF